MTTIVVRLIIETLYSRSLFYIKIAFLWGIGENMDISSFIITYNTETLLYYYYKQMILININKYWSCHNNSQSLKGLWNQHNVCWCGVEANVSNL